MSRRASSRRRRRDRPKLHHSHPTEKIIRSIVGAIIDLSHVLDLTVTSEGVQTARELSEIVELGADHAQRLNFSPAKRLSADALRRQRVQPPP